MSHAELPPRYILTLTKNPPNRRTKFRKLKHAESYFECKANVPVGRTAYYSVRLRPQELEQAISDARDPNENLIRVEPDGHDEWRWSYEIPNEPSAKYLMLPETWDGDGDPSPDGNGVKLCVIDTGLAPATNARYRVPPIGKSFIEDDPTAPWNADTNEVHHGTWMASAAAANTRISLMVARKSNLTSNAIAALNWAIDNGAHVVTMSFGGPTRVQAFQDAITRGKDAGVLMFAALPNDNNRATTDYPSSYDGIQAISDFNNETDAKTNTSSWAPYTWAASTGRKVTKLNDDNTTAQVTDGGTSHSTAMAGRVAALLRGQGVSAGNVITHLEATARVVNGWTTEHQGHGVLQFQKALDRVKATPVMPTDPNGKITLPDGAKVTPAPPQVAAPPPPSLNLPPGTQIQPTEPPQYRPPPYDPGGSFDLPGGGSGYSPIPDTPSYPIADGSLIEPFGGEEPSETSGVEPEGLCQQPGLPDEVPDQEQPPPPPPEPDEPDPVCAMYGTPLLIDLPLTEDNIAVRNCLTGNGWYCDPPDCGGRIYAPPTRQNTGYILLSEIGPECEDLLTRINWTKTATTMYPPDYWWHCD